MTCITPMYDLADSAGDIWLDTCVWGCQTLCAAPRVSTWYHSVGAISPFPWLEEWCDYGVAGYSHLANRCGFS